MFRTPLRQEDRTPSIVAEEGETLLVGRVDHAAVAVAADDQRPAAGPRRHELRGGHQREDEPGARRLHVKSRAAELEPVLHQAFAVEGKHMSGVNVPTTRRSISDGSTSAAFRQRTAAWVQRSLVAWWGKANLRLG